MAQLVWKKLIGQQHIKDVLGAAFAKDSFGHAYLFCGEDGVGTFQAAVELALALLCEKSDEAPCYQCDSCRQLLNYNHPDFHCVFPVALQKEHKSSDKGLNEAGWSYLAEVCREKIANPYQAIEWSGTRRFCAGRSKAGATSPASAAWTRSTRSRPTPCSRRSRSRRPTR
jgi:hypothetical protein